MVTQCCLQPAAAAFLHSASTFGQTGRVKVHEILTIPVKQRKESTRAAC